MENVARIVTICLVTSVLFACSYPLAELGLIKSGKEIKVFDLQAFSNKKIDFDLVKSVPLRTCLECHTTGSRSMDSAEKVLKLKGDILESIHKNSMPPKSSGYAPLSDCEKKILETWIEDQEQGRASGVLVKDIPACADAKAPVAKPKTDFKNLELSFENLQKEILAPKCLSCHATDSPGYQYALDDLQRMKDNELIMATADESLLYQVTVPGRVKYFMPPKNKGIPPLTEEEQDYLKRWIEAGAN